MSYNDKGHRILLICIYDYVYIINGTTNVMIKIKTAQFTIYFKWSLSYVRMQQINDWWLSL